MSRHVVLLRRDPSLGLALRALLHGNGRVTELQNIQAWSAMPAEGIDAVVIDLPPSRRKQAVDLVRSRFGGRLILVLDPHDDPAAVPANHAYSMVQRPFEIVELWQLVTTDPSGGQGGSRAAEPGRQAGPGSSDDLGRPGRRQVPEGGEAPAAKGAERPRAAEPGPAAGRPAADASTWKWRGRRYGPATAMPPDPPGGEQVSGAPPGSRRGPDEADRRQSESRRWGAL
ncbi:MAG: hypothetical protein ACJ75C_19830, partial [Actinomycetes bacterium]